MHSQLSERITPARSLRRTIAALAAAAVLLAAPRHARPSCRFRPSGAQVNDDLANAIDPSQDAGVSDVAGGAVTAGKVQVPWATFEQKVAGGAQQIFVRAFKNGAWVTQGSPGVAQHRPDPGGRSAVDRLRRRGTHGPVGRVVRAERGLRVADEHLRQPFQRGGQRLAALRPGQGPGPPPVPQHPPHSHGREPLGRGRRRRRGQRSGSVDHLGGERRRLERRHDAAADLRGEGGEAGRSGNGLPGRDEARGRSRRERILLAASRTRTAEPDWSAPVRQRRSHAQHRPDPLGRRAGHRVHRSERHRRVGRVVRGRSHPDRRASRATTWSSRPRSSRTPQPTVASTGSRSATERPARPTSSTPRARTASAAAPRARTPRTRARSTRSSAATRRTRASPPARSRRAVRPCRGWSGRRTSASGQARRLRLATGGRRPLRALQRRPAGVEHGERRDATRHHVLRQRAVHLLAGDGIRGADDLRRTLRGWAPPRRSSSSTRRPASRTPASATSRPAPRPDLVRLHGQPDQRRRRDLPGRRHRDAVPPLHRGQDRHARSSSPRPSRRPTCRRSPRPTSPTRTRRSNGSANPGGAAILTRFDFGATTAYGTSTPDARLDVASVPTRFDATLSGLTQDDDRSLQSRRERRTSSPSTVPTRASWSRTRRRPSRSTTFPTRCAEETSAAVGS